MLEGEGRAAERAARRGRGAARARLRDDARADAASRRRHRPVPAADGRPRRGARHRPGPDPPRRRALGPRPGGVRVKLEQAPRPIVETVRRSGSACPVSVDDAATRWAIEAVARGPIALDGARHAERRVSIRAAFCGHGDPERRRATRRLQRGEAPLELGGGCVVKRTSTSVPGFAPSFRERRARASSAGMPGREELALALRRRAAPRRVAAPASVSRTVSASGRNVRPAASARESSRAGSCRQSSSPARPERQLHPRPHLRSTRNALVDPACVPLERAARSSSAPSVSSPAGPVALKTPAGAVLGAAARSTRRGRGRRSNCTGRSASPARAPRRRARAAAASR